MPAEIKFSVHRPGCDRVHHVSPDDIRVVLSRLPDEIKTRLRAVHLNDRSRGARTLGYVNMGHREIGICALSPRISLARFLSERDSPKQYGARRGHQWPLVAIRRFMLYNTLLHELGHLQVIDEDAKSERRKFALETRAQDFADYWRKKLWVEPFDHPDPAHNPPSEEELSDPDPEFSDLRRRVAQLPQSADLREKLGRLCLKRGMTGEAKTAYEEALAFHPNDPWPHLYLGNWYYAREDYQTALTWFRRAAELAPPNATAYWCMADAQHALGSVEQADLNYRRAVEVDPRDRIARANLRRWRMIQRESSRPASGIGTTTEPDGEETTWAG